MKEEFVAACNNTTKSFNAIIQALQLSKGVDPSEVTRLLSFIDSIIEYYLQLDKQETIRYPIIYIPCSKDWAEEVCLEYVSYKIEIAFDGNRMHYLENEFGCIDATRMGLNDKGVKKEWEWRKVIKPVVRSMANNYDNIRNLIVCGQSIYNRLTKKQRLVRLLGDSPQTSIVCTDVNTVKKTCADYKAFENIFCFYNNKGVSDKYEIGSLFNWTGLKNCFIFEFSSTPYCLHNVLGCGKRLCENLPHKSLLSQNNENIYPDFITLTAEESRYLFNEESQNAHVVIHYPSEIEEDINHVVDFYKGEDDDWHFSIKDRNILSLCLCQEAKTAYMDFLKQEKPILSMNYPEWNSFFNSMLDCFPMQEIVSRILSFVQHDTIVAFVICDTPITIKEAVKHFFFERCGMTIKYYQYKDLKEKTVRENKIVVLCFRPHNISSQFPYKNPNSFDEFPLNEGQSILDIINELTIIDFVKYQYEYDLNLRIATCSQYRRDILGGALAIPRKPKVQYVSDFNETDDDACEQIQPNSISTVRFELNDGTSCSLPETEVLIYENNRGEQYIDNIRNLKTNEQLREIISIQPISELADSTLDIFFQDSKSTSLFEESLREQYVNEGLIPQNHCHEVPIWKFLLERKIRDYCIEKGIVTDKQTEPLFQLLHNKLDNEYVKELPSLIGVQVQPARILQWCDVSSVKPYAPGKKKNRIQLFIHYLGLSSRVSTMYHRKQSLIKNKTREKNKITESFLCAILFNDITNELVTELLENSQYVESLAIESKEDIETLKAIALEHINLRQVKSYTI